MVQYILSVIVSTRSDTTMIHTINTESGFHDCNKKGAESFSPKNDVLYGAYMTESIFSGGWGVVSRLKEWRNRPI